MQIVIIGAGIAGVAAAITLEDRGHTVQVYERHPSASTIGAGVVLWPNASFVLGELGVLEQLAALGGRPTAMKRFDQLGSALGEVDIRELDAVMGRSSYSVLRRDLHRVLLERAAARGISITYGHAACELGEDGVRPWVRFEHGVRVDADLIIGADGRMTSVSRCYVDPARTAIDHGFVNWVGIAESSEPLVDDPGAILDFWGVGHRFGVVPIDRHLVYWAGGQASAKSDAATANDSGQEDDLRREIEAAFASWPAIVHRVIDASRGHAIRKIRVHDVDPEPGWRRGRVLLIGDAAHAPLPTSGQGACQALEDAWHLGQMLPADLDAAVVEATLDTFVARRYDKTSRIIAAGRQLATRLFHADPHECQRRNDAARGNDAKQVARAMARFWSAGLPRRVT